VRAGVADEFGAAPRGGLAAARPPPGPARRDAAALASSVPALAAAVDAAAASRQPEAVVAWLAVLATALRGRLGVRAAVSAANLAPADVGAAVTAALGAATRVLERGGRRQGPRRRSPPLPPS